MKNVIATGLFVITTAFAASSIAANHEVKMLNNGKDGIMVFDPPFLKAAKGDTVKFVPTDPGHDVASVSVPKGAKTWSGAIGKAVTVKMTEEGVYVYECNAHIAMAMVGVIQVGKAINLADAQKASKELATKFVMNKDRLDKYLAKAK